MSIIYTLAGHHKVERLRRAVWSKKPCGPFLLTVPNPDETTRFAIRGRAETLHITLPKEEITEAAPPGRGEHILARFLEPSPELETCAHQLLVAMHDGSGAARRPAS